MSSIDTIALNCLVFEKIAFFILATDRQTDDGIDALSHCHCRERRLNKLFSSKSPPAWTHRTFQCDIQNFFSPRYQSMAHVGQHFNVWEKSLQKTLLLSLPRRPLEIDRRVEGLVGHLALSSTYVRTLSVCLSVTRRYCVETAEHIITLFTVGIATPFFFLHLTAWQYSDGDITGAGSLAPGLEVTGKFNQQKAPLWPSSTM